MARGPGRGKNADLPVALAAIVGFVVYVWVLARSATSIVTALLTLSGNNPLAYAALLALLVGLPGLLFTLPRALARRRGLIEPMVRSRGQLASRRTSHLRADILGLAALLLARGRRCQRRGTRRAGRRRSPTSRCPHRLSISAPASAPGRSG